MSTPACKPGNLEDVAGDDDDDEEEEDDNDGNDNDNEDKYDQAGVDDLEVLQAALLHDTVEDTDTNLQVMLIIRS